MFLKRFLICLIIVSILLELSLCQTKPKRKNRNRNRKPKDEEERIKCWSCYIDFRSQKFDRKGRELCYNPWFNETHTDVLYLTQCSPQTKFCAVDITRINNVLAIIDRRCGQGPHCRPYCISKGFGVNNQVCSYCCKGKLSEDDDDYDPDEHGNYTCPTVPH